MGRKSSGTSYPKIRPGIERRDPRMIDVPMRRLGARGPNLSRVGFGAWAIGGPWRYGWGEVDDDRSVASIRHAIESGVNWIDTAPAYGLGHSEEVVAEAIKPWTPGEDVYVFTKCGQRFADGEDRDVQRDLRPGSIRYECEQSLKRLNIERIDLYQFHWPDNRTGTPIEPTCTSCPRGAKLAIGEVSERP